MPMIQVSVLGSTGYGGIELVRLLTSHPKVKIYKLVSHSYAGKSLSDVYPNFIAHEDICLSELDIDDIADNSQLVFTSLPHGASSKIIPLLYEKGVRIVDLSETSAIYQLRSLKIGMDTNILVLSFYKNPPMVCGAS